MKLSEHRELKRPRHLLHSLLLDASHGGSSEMETQHVPAVVNGQHVQVAPTSFPVGPDGTSTVLHRLTA
jgi:hypothetical protein